FGDFKFEPTEDAVIQAGGESRYLITIDVSGLKDGKEHKIQAVAKMDNGDIVKLNRFEDGKDRDAYVNYKAQYVEQPHTDPVPQTGDATVALISIVAVISLAAVVIFRKRAF
ncbi:MAG: NPXTG-anchored protein, partial [Clostridia bacterium]|nr:NPXTG-anchored protein [Clostridia bacterium]